MKAIFSRCLAACIIVLTAISTSADTGGIDFLVFANGSTEGTAASGEITVANSARVELHTDQLGWQIFYTLDGSTPTFASALYTNAIQLNETTDIKAVAYNADFSQSSSASLHVIVAPEFTLTVAGSGEITLSPPGGSYISNTVVTVTAHDGNGWTFSHWIGAAEGTNNTVEVTMDSNKSIQGIFLTHLTTVPTEGGSILVEPANAEIGTTVKVTAIPDETHYFAAWGGVLTGNQNPTTFRITSPTQLVSAAFASLGTNQAWLSVTVDDYLFPTISPLKNVYTKGENVLVSIEPYSWLYNGANLLDYSYIFRGWSGDVETFDNPASITLEGNTTIHGNIEPAQEQKVFLPGFRESIPAIGNDGTVYITSGTALFAVTPDLQVKWTNVTGQTELSVPSVGHSGLIYVGASNGDIVAVNKSGQTVWSFSSGEPKANNPFPEFYQQGHPVAVASDETIYSMSSASQKVYSVKNGALVRMVPAFPIIAEDDTLYISTGSGFSATKPDGTTLWNASYPRPIAIGSNGDLYGLNGTTIYALHSNGQFYWQTNIPSGASSILVGETNTLFTSTSNGVVAISSSGQVLWTNKYSGNIVPTADGGYYNLQDYYGPQLTFPIDHVLWVRSVTASGSNSWFFEHDAYVSKKSNAHPIATLSGSGDLFYSALSSFHAGGKPASSTWGMALGNAQNTGRAESLNRTYTLEVVGSGSVTRNPRQVTLPMNSEVTFTAVPSEGGKFLHWSGDISGTENPITVTLDSNKQIVAVFEAGFQLNVTAGADGKLNLSSTSAASGIQVQVSTDLETWTTLGPLEQNSQVTPGIEGRKFYRLISE